MFETGFETFKKLAQTHTYIITLSYAAQLDEIYL